MITTILTFAIIYFVIWACFKLLGLILKVALFPVKIVLSLLFAIIGYVVFPALLIFFVIPLIVVLIIGLIGNAVVL